LLKAAFFLAEAGQSESGEPQRVEALAAMILQPCIPGSLKGCVASRKAAKGAKGKLQSS
jgi:hypothetical protein